MEIVIGRDLKTSQLRIVSDGKEVLCEKAGSVPPSVGNQHCCITISTTGMRLRNLDINNYSFINGKPVESRNVSETDKIELGRDRYVLNWGVLRNLLPVDIRSLERISDDYEKQKIKLQIEERRFNSIRSIAGIFTMTIIPLSIITGRRNGWLLALYAIAFLIAVITTVKAFLNSSAIPKKVQEMNKQFQRDYVCPRCRRFLGNITYEILAQNDSCPHCKAKFIH